LKYILLLTTLISFSLLARDAVEEKGACRLNWTQGFIVCEGESAEGQGSYGAKLSAKVIVQRNMLEVIKGVQIDSQVTVEDGLLSSDIIKSRVSGVVRGAQIISNHYNSDNGSAIATAKMMMGKDLLSALLSDPNKLSWNEKIAKVWSGFSFLTTANASTYGYQDKELLNKLMQDLRDRGEKRSSQYIEGILKDISNNIYSGIMIDVSNVSKFEKALLVNLVDSDGNEIYPADIIDHDTLVQKNTSVGFIYGFDDARNDKRVFDKPLEIKATSIFANRKSTIVLTKEQIETIKALPSKVLSEGKIIVVLGD